MTPKAPSFFFNFIFFYSAAEKLSQNASDSKNASFTYQTILQFSVDTQWVFDNLIHFWH